MISLADINTRVVRLPGLQGAADNETLPSEEVAGNGWRMWRTAGSRGQIATGTYLFLASPSTEFVAGLVFTTLFGYFGVMKSADNSSVWNSPAFPVPPSANMSLMLRLNGELQLSVDGVPVWQAGTAGLGGDVLKLLNSGKLVIVSTTRSNATVWETGDDLLSPPGGRAINAPAGAPKPSPTSPPVVETPSAPLPPVVEAEPPPPPPPRVKTSFRYPPPPPESEENGTPKGVITSPSAPGVSFALSSRFHARSALILVLCLFM